MNPNNARAISDRVTKLLGCLGLDLLDILKFTA